MSDTDQVEVIFVGARGTDARFIPLTEGLTARAAVDASGVCARHPEIDFASFGLGIWGRVVAPDQRLNPGDRVEIYAPLEVDAQTARRVRAES